MKIINCSESEFLKKVLKEDFKIIIFGTGKLAQEALEVDPIRKHLAYFVDNDPKKHNKYLICRGKDYVIQSPQILLEAFLDTHAILICSTHFEAITAQLNALDALNSVECYIFPVIRLNFADKEEQFEKRVLSPCLSEYSTILAKSGLTADEQQQKLNTKRDYILGNGKNGRPLVFPRIMIMPTTVCNMKCKDCSSLFPYFDNPAHMDIDKIIEDLELFFSAVDECIRITIGGEPFLYPDLEKLLSYLIDQPKLSGILTFTNSTITPKEPIVNLLKNEKVEIFISDYGYIEKMSHIVSLFEAYEIQFSVLADQQWIDMGDTHFRNKNDETRRLEYQNCEQSLLMKAIYDGKMFSCARSARMYALGAYSSVSDYFDLSGKDTPSLRESINALLYKETADSCNYCDCGKFPTKMISAGIQLNDEKKPHSAYTIVKRDEYEKFKELAKINEKLV